MEAEPKRDTVELPQREDDPTAGHRVPEKITVYAHPACPQTPGVIAMLKQSRVDYDYLNIRAPGQNTAREWVKAVNNGYESVPTIEFVDGSTLTEPSPTALRARLNELGYRVPLSALLLANWNWIVIGAGVLLALLVALGVI